jgi:hypothetical protein
MTSKNAKRIKALRQKRVPFDSYTNCSFNSRDKQNKIVKAFKAAALLLLHSILLSFALYEH